MAVGQLFIVNRTEAWLQLPGLLAAATVLLCGSFMAIFGPWKNDVNATRHSTSTRLFASAYRALFVGYTVLYIFDDARKTEDDLQRQLRLVPSVAPALVAVNLALGAVHGSMPEVHSKAHMLLAAHIALTVLRCVGLALATSEWALSGVRMFLSSLPTVLGFVMTYYVYVRRARMANGQEIYVAHPFV